MRILTFDDNGDAKPGVRIGDEVVDLTVAALDLPGTVHGIVAAGPAALERAAAAAAAAPAAARRPLAGIRHQLPIPEPSKIICLGLNYADHAKEGGHAKPEYPSFFMRGPSSLVAHGQPMVRPRVCEQLDYEAELLAVVGRRARHVPRDDALSVIAAYSCFNDGSVRAYQRKTSQWTIGKNFDATGGFGPELVTADELPPGATGLRIRSILNGETMQDANTDDMLFDVAETVALLTECMTLEAGDLIAMGTPAGVGHARDPQVWMKDGDVCEIDIEGVGILRNPIVEETATG